MAITGVNGYNGVYESTYAASKKEAAKKEETKETAATQKSTETAKGNSASDYLSKLQNKFQKMTFEIGSGVSTKNEGNNDIFHFSVSPKLIEKMQSSPEAEKEYTKRLKDIESATKWLEGYMKSAGRTCEWSNSYIDEDGKLHHAARWVRKDELNEKLRKEAQENAEKQIEKSRENAREKAEQLAEKLEEKAEEVKKSKEEQAADGKIQISGNSAKDKAEQLLNEKISNAKDGAIYLYDTDIQTIIEAAKEDGEDKAVSKQQAEVGANLDLKI